MGLVAKLSDWRSSSIQVGGYRFFTSLIDKLSKYIGVGEMGMTGVKRERSPIRVLVAKAGLDGHDRGAKIVARALRDAGMEVVYTGLHQTAEMIVKSALEEDVHFIGLSILSGAHMTLFPAVAKLLRKRKIKDIIIFGGGIIPEDDARALKKQGVKEIFPPGSSTRDIVKWVKENVPKK